MRKPLATSTGNPVGRPRSRCFRCGEPYYRRNFFEAWITRNPGKRDGWAKTKIRVCLDCMDIPSTRQALAKMTLIISDIDAMRRDIAKREAVLSSMGRVVKKIRRRA